jgi:tungstate transport system permease protein
VQDIGRALLLAFQLIGSLDSELLAIILFSLEISLTASLVACCLGVPVGALLTTSQFPGRQACIIAIHALLGLPPVAVGLFVYLMLSRSGPFGGLGLLFSPSAMIVAQVLLGIPIAMAFVYRSVEPSWREFRDAFAVTGATKLRGAIELLKMRRAAILTAFLATFGRTISEVGAIIVVGGNIRGYTRTMTTTIALETSKGDLPLALALGIILIFISLAVSGMTFGLAALFETSASRVGVRKE